MKNMLSRDTVFARPLCRYATQYGVVSVFAHEQFRNFCIIRSELTGQIVGLSLAICPAESLVRRDIGNEATPACNLSKFRVPSRPLRTQSEVDSDY